MESRGVLPPLHAPFIFGPSLHIRLFYIYIAVALMPDWMGLFSSSNAADANEYLDLSCCAVHEVERVPFV